MEDEEKKEQETVKTFSGGNERQGLKRYHVRAESPPGRPKKKFRLILKNNSLYIVIFNKFSIFEVFMHEHRCKL